MGHLSQMVQVLATQMGQPQAAQAARVTSQSVTVLASYCASLPMLPFMMFYLLRSQSASLSGM